MFQISHWELSSTPGDGEERHAGPPAPGGQSLSVVIQDSVEPPNQISLHYWIGCKASTAIGCSDYNFDGLPNEDEYGPFVDSYQFSQMGKRKPWIVGSLILLSIAFFLSSNIISIQISPLLIGLSLFFIMLCTSILDVATDGLAIDILEENERGLSNGLMWGARTFGVSFAALLGSFLLKNNGLSQAFVYFGIYHTR